MTKKKIAIVCGSCGSTNVRRDAWADWSEEQQTWVLGTVFDAGHCDDCGGESRLEEVPAGSPMAECQNCDWEGLEENLKPIKHLHQRVAAGETMPAGECPHCGALAHAAAP